MVAWSTFTRVHLLKNWTQTLFHGTWENQYDINKQYIYLKNSVSDRTEVRYIPCYFVRSKSFQRCFLLQLLYFQALGNLEMFSLSWKIDYFCIMHSNLKWFHVVIVPGACQYVGECLHWASFPGLFLLPFISCFD